MDSMINDKDRDGNTPLHLSIIKGDKNKAIALLERPVIDWRIKNDEHQTPMDLLKALEGNIDTTYNLPMRIIQHAIEIRQSAMHPLNLALVCPPSYKKINHLKKCLTHRNIQELKKMMDGITLVATLVVTLTFAVAFTIPGGYEDETGSIVLIKKPALRLFFYSDTIALLLCILIMLDYAWSYTAIDTEELGKKVYRQTITLSVSLAIVIVTFISGLYAVVPHSKLWLMHCISVFTSIVIFNLLLNEPISFLLTRFPVCCIKGPLTGVVEAAVKDWRAKKKLISNHSSKKQN